MARYKYSFCGVNYPSGRGSRETFVGSFPFRGTGLYVRPSRGSVRGFVRDLWYPS